MSIAALRLLELLPRRPVLTVASVMKLVETTKPTAGRAIELLVAAGVLVETTGRKRDRSFAYQSYLARLRVGTELDHRATGTSRRSSRGSGAGFP
jgi:cell filamentation protein, protein adenylyltransferase